VEIFCSLGKINVLYWSNIVVVQILLKFEKSKIQKIILAHTALVCEYDKILKSANGEGFFIKGTYKSHSLRQLIRLITDRDTSYFDKIVLLTFWFALDIGLFGGGLSTLFAFITRFQKYPSKVLIIFIQPIIRSFVKYLIKIHIRRQYQAIYRLYLSEIIIPNRTRENEDEIDCLRDIATDLRDYLNTLPNTKNIFASMAAVFSVITAAIGLLNIEGLIFQFLLDLPSYIFITMIIAIISIGYFITIPFLHAFRFKRALFLRTDWQHYLDDIYLGNEQELYNNSVYKFENDLFDALDVRNQKLNELPFDKIFIIFMGALMISFLAYLGLSVVYDATAVSFEQSIQNVLVTMLIVPILTFYAIIIPVLTYRRRRRSNLL
jgi:hypothetical protein